MTVKAKNGPRTADGPALEDLEVLAAPLHHLVGADPNEPRPDFKVLSGKMELVKAAASADGKRRIKCIASSSMKDLHGDTMTDHCIRSMAKQAPGLTIFLNHKYGIPEDVFGYVEKARTKKHDAASAKAAGISDEVILKATTSGSDILLLELTVVLDEGSARADRVYNQMDNGITLGVSIGALITDYEEDPEYQGDWWPPLIINDVDLLEASVVGIPANPLSWVEGAAKGLIQRGLIKNADDETFNSFRRFALLKEQEALKEENVKNKTPEASTPEVEAGGEPEVEASTDPAEPPKMDGLDEIVAHFQFAVEAKLMSATDLDAMEDSVQKAIDYAVERGVDKAEFEGQTAKDIAMQILSSEPALADGSDTAGEETTKAEDSATPDSGQEAPVSDPAPGNEEAAKEAAEAQIQALAEAGVLSSLGEVIGLFQQSLETALATKAENEALRSQIETLTAQLETANDNVKAAVEFVDKVMALPMGRKSTVRREAASFGESLKGGPYSSEVLAYIAKNSSAGASDGS